MKSKTLRKHIRNLIMTFVPKVIQHKLLRRFIKLDWNPSHNLKFKLAETKDELAQAFTLLHDAYVRSGFMTPHSSGMRVTKFRSLPSTSTLIATINGKVVGTVSLIRSSAFGLPVDSIFDLSSYREKGARIVEVSSLAVHQDFSGRQGEILMPLIKFLFQYSMKCFGASHFVIAVNPSWIVFYEAILLFKRLKKRTVSNYSFVNGAPADGAILDLSQAHIDYKETYGNQPPHRNLFDYVVNHKLPNLEFPQRQIKKISDPVMKPELLNYFFNEQTKTMSEMSPFELAVLNEVYSLKDYHLIIPRNKSSEKAWPQRTRRRHEISCSGEILLPNRELIPIDIQCGSENGLSGFASRNFRHLEKLNCYVILNGSTLRLDIVALWKSGQSRYGFKIINPPIQWRRFISNVDRDFSEKTNPGIAS